jgi:uncharacterized membrane protein HdeD (DUF308 family)
MITIEYEDDRGRADPAPLGFDIPWGALLALGILWMLIAFAVLPAGYTSVTAIGYLTAGVLLAAGLTELLTIAVVRSWRWVHAVLGALFLALGVTAVLSPAQTFGVLAVLIGWYLLLKGMAMAVLSLFGRGALPLWGLGLAVGVAEMAIGVWAIGSPARSSWLLILWVGLGALFRGMSEIVLAFQVRAARTSR